MSVQIKEIITDENETGILEKSGVNADMLEEITKHVNAATAGAIDRAYAYADAVSRDMISKVKTELSQFAKPRQQVMCVEVDKIQRKLSLPASPYLGRVLTEVKLGNNVLLVGPRGCGKTTLAAQVGEALGLPCDHLCLTAGASETWLFGRQTPTGFIEAGFSKAYRNGGVFLLDELCAADPNMLMAINTALENGSMYNPMSGETLKRHENFVCIAADNTAGRGSDGIYTARNRLDAAGLERFVLIPVDYQDDIERQACPCDELRKIFQDARAKLKKLNSDETISTRKMRVVYEQTLAGVSFKDAMASLTAGWQSEMISQAGLDDVKYRPESKRDDESPSADDLKRQMEEAQSENNRLKKSQAAQKAHSFADEVKAMQAGT